MAERIEILLGVETSGDLMHIELDGGLRHPYGKGDGIRWKLLRTIVTDVFVSWCVCQSVCHAPAPCPVGVVIPGSKEHFIRWAPILLRQGKGSDKISILL